MSTVIRPEISEKNKYWISKHRFYELRHFCLQYREWERERLNIIWVPSAQLGTTPSSTPSNLTEEQAIRLEELDSKIY